MDISNTMTMDVNENTDLGTPEYELASEAQKNAAVKVEASHFRRPEFTKLLLSQD